VRFVVVPWRRFWAKRDKTVDRRFLDALGHEAEDRFRAGMALPKSGVKYPNLPRRSSRAGEFPANQFGPLIRSIASDATATDVTVGSNMPYSLWLRTGTRKMQARKMAPEALDEAIPRVRSMLKGFVTWQR
jgi:phage gpG-like protein